MIKDLSVVICNKNSITFLKKSIPVYKKCNLKELIVIDGDSNDGSIEYLKKQKIIFFSDRGKGLSYSRQLGLSKSKCNFVFIAGPDDICDKLFFEKLDLKFKKSKYDAATILLKIFRVKTYWDQCINLWLEYIRNAGEANVIGTPTIFKRKVFNKIKYNINTQGCDDTDISDQLKKNNFKIGVLDIYCNQINENKLIDIKKKFQLYGKSDANFYKFKNKKFNLFNLKKIKTSKQSKDNEKDKPMSKWAEWGTIILAIIFGRLFGLLGVAAVAAGYGVYYLLDKEYNKAISITAGVIAGIASYLLIIAVILS